MVSFGKKLFVDAEKENSGLARYMNDDHKTPDAKAIPYQDSCSFFLKKII